MVLYVPGLVSWACSWADCCRAQEGRRRANHLLQEEQPLGWSIFYVLRSKHCSASHFAGRGSWNLWCSDFLNLNWPWLLCFLGKSSLSFAKGWAFCLLPRNERKLLHAMAKSLNPQSPLVPLALGVGFPGQPVRQLQSSPRVLKEISILEARCASVDRTDHPHRGQSGLSPTCPLPGLAHGYNCFQRCQHLEEVLTVLRLWSQLYISDDVELGFFQFVLAFLSFR